MTVALWGTALGVIVFAIAAIAFVANLGSFNK